uniref:Uncharacterized protein n=1 Tax=Oryza barthii TaxID=65489 RepID=A0A0D3FNU1_9ORYZ
MRHAIPDLIRYEAEITSSRGLFGKRITVAPGVLVSGGSPNEEGQDWKQIEDGRRRPVAVSYSHGRRLRCIAEGRREEEEEEVGRSRRGKDLDLDDSEGIWRDCHPSRPPARWQGGGLP